MHTSKYGKSTLTKSPITISSLRCSGLFVEYNRQLPFKINMKSPNSLSLHTLQQFSRHARIHLHRRHILRLLQNFDRQIAGSRSYFENFVCRAEVCLVDDSVVKSSI